MLSFVDVIEPRVIQVLNTYAEWLNVRVPQSQGYMMHSHFYSTLVSLPCEYPQSNMRKWSARLQVCAHLVAFANSAVTRRRRRE